jgi:hypothetical protein
LVLVQQQHKKVSKPSAPSKILIDFQVAASLNFLSSLRSEI